MASVEGIYIVYMYTDNCVHYMCGVAMERREHAQRKIHVHIYTLYVHRDLPTVVSRHCQFSEFTILNLGMSYHNPFTYSSLSD